MAEQLAWNATLWWNDDQGIIRATCMGTPFLEVRRPLGPLVRPPVGRGNPVSPLQQLFRTIVAVDRQKNKIVIPCYCKMMLKPDLFKPGRQIAAYRNCGSRRIAVCCRQVLFRCRPLGSGLNRSEHRFLGLLLEDKARRWPNENCGDNAAHGAKYRVFSWDRIDWCSRRAPNAP